MALCLTPFQRREQRRIEAHRQRRAELLDSNRPIASRPATASPPPAVPPPVLMSMSNLRYTDRDIEARGGNMVSI
ncbi:hypothetical protein DL93DRAFT_2091511 [Clavulina sp. PMI_390]|nr:hypothetical protein DL93DRAFT_2091511 [Clavulina sp. PMI_390]